MPCPRPDALPLYASMPSSVFTPLQQCNCASAQLIIMSDSQPQQARDKPMAGAVVEDVMPIAMGLEHEELAAELNGEKRFDMEPPVGPFGTKVRH
ncbi:hypothetical protein GUJ93_ZPchr0010g10513 [Zizania palustris]|uniref:Uncharacterized protein n=1 Tax=Zizania palustris TaxID=103762 RepID=A0A8J6BLK7_ZIZPA|nr:hypothetical protein GUJ93_ZPchr0010g10513 [Zizania palustris]